MITTVVQATPAATASGARAAPTMVVGLMLGGGVITIESGSAS